jgi:uncharacterized protein (DUF486 family)
MTSILLIATLIFGPPSLYLAVRSRDVRKFLAGAFFVSGGIQFYLYLVNLTVPIIGTSFAQTPELSRVRSIIHLLGFLLCFYFGFIKKPKATSR